MEVIWRNAVWIPFFILSLCLLPFAFVAAAAVFAYKLAQEIIGWSAK
jgi:hypothetical protein